MRVYRNIGDGVGISYRVPVLLGSLVGFIVLDSVAKAIGGWGPVLFTLGITLAIWFSRQAYIKYYEQPRKTQHEQVEYGYLIERERLQQENAMAEQQQRWLHEMQNPPLRHRDTW